MIKVRELIDDGFLDNTPLYRVEELIELVNSHEFASTEEDMLQFSDIFSKLDKLPNGEKLPIAITVFNEKYYGTNGYEYQGLISKYEYINKFGVSNQEYYVEFPTNECRDDGDIEFVSGGISFRPDIRQWDIVY